MRPMRNFARKVVTNVLLSIDLYTNIVIWKNTAWSILIFSASMYDGVYRNEFSSVSIYLQIILWECHQKWTHISPSWEELFFSLVKGGSRIEPLSTKVRLSMRREKNCHHEDFPRSSLKIVPTVNRAIGCFVCWDFIRL